MALTDAEKQELLNAIKAESQSVDELETVETLDGLTSLPALKGEQLVNAPLSLLRKPAEEAAQTARDAAGCASQAASNANEAVAKVNTAIENVNAAGDSANTAAETATSAAGRAETAAANYENTALAALNGATARFAAIVETASIQPASSIAVGGRIVYVRSAKKFAYQAAGNYYSGWSVEGVPSAGLYMNDGLSAILKDKAYLCDDVLYVWSDEEGDLVEISGSGGGNTINVTEAYPLADGYYTLVAAIAAVEDKRRAKGRCITFETSQGKWVTKQFVGTSLDTWDSEASWEDFGGAGTVKSITVNGSKKTPDASGNVNVVIDEVEVDETLDAGSTNPVQNSAVTGKLNEIDASTVFGMSAEVSDDESTVRVALTNKSGAEIASVEIPAGSGGGGGEATATKIVLNAEVDNTTIKEGGNAKLTYTFDHQYSSGDDKGVSTGQKATVTITLLRGSTTTYSSTVQEVSKGSYELDISKYLFAGTTDIYVRATTTDPTTGRTQTKQSYVSVKVVTLSLSSSYNLANSIANGGYGASETVGIPYAVSGSGTKVISLYVDGMQQNTATVTRSGTTNGSFNLSMSGLSIGRHTVQMVAEMEAAENLVLRSESVYLDIFKRGSGSPLIGTMHTFKDGRIFTTNHLVPNIDVGQYEELRFEFVVYDPDATPSAVAVYRNNVLSQTVSVPRSAQIYSNRFLTQGSNAMKFVCGTTEYPFNIEVTESGIDISETTYGLALKLSATGRSNEESNPAVWESGDVRTTFENVDWKTSGWIDNALKLINGARATVGITPMRTDASTAGATYEFEFRISNVIDRDAPVISCMDGNKGFKITAEEAAMYTGSTKDVTTDDGSTLTTPVGVAMKFASDKWFKIAFVIGKRADGRLMELYINGIRSKADIYGAGDYFSQDNPQPITISSDGADVEVRNVRIYDRAISDDEEFSNFTIDRETIDEMSLLIQNNDVLDDDTGEVSIDKLLKKGKGVILFVRAGGLDEVNATNNKSQDFLCSHVFIYTPWGDVWEIRNCYIRIQGTSSTKYPRKNYRIYCAKGQSPEVYLNGVKQDSNKIPVMLGDIPVKVLCPKCDYSDSSMTHNTGWARLFNDIMKELGLLTPAQEVDSTVRSTINGYPVDVFSAETIDGERTYYGQYNLNNDKGDWADVTGMSAVTGADGNKVEWECPIAFEFLNNSYPLDKFQLYGKTDSEVDAELDAGFDDALEFNYPKDVYWNAQKAAEEEGTVATAKQKAAYKRLITWIRDCVPAGADMTCKDLSTWKSEKFRTEISQYFFVNYLLTYLIITDYNAMVDQRVKNMIMRTWDGLKWLISYYDGDTMLLLRNDSFLKYLYTLMRETYDAEKGGYAFEGFDSWLWCLVWANMETELKACANNLRRVMTNQRVLDMLNKEQAGNWCERIYNKSGKFKYIDPQVNGVELNGNTVTYPYIYALQGNREAHRTHTIINRYALLDARYETGNYTSDNIDLYMSRMASDAATQMNVTANEVYYFGYGTNNTPSIQASQKAEEGESVTLTFRDAFSLNDPMRIYGASRMRKLTTGTAGNQLVGNINLNKCVTLQVLDMSTTGTGGDFYMNLDNCRQLTEVNLSGQSKVRTGSQASTELDFSNQTRLAKFNGRGTSVKSILFAKGAPLMSSTLPSTLTVLRLEYLPKLQMSGLTVSGYSSVETFIFSNCPGLNWQTLAGRCTNAVRMRVEGLSLEGDGSLLDSYMDMKGVDADGNAVEYCALAGSYKLDRYPADEELEAWRAHYPELNILLPQYTMIEFDDSIPDDANVTNLDNGTGSSYGTEYVPSGHISAILNGRHRVLAKVTKKATTRNVNMAGVDTVMNNLDGEMTYYPLDDTDSNKYADGSAAKLDGSEGDWMMFEPFFWSKGINDYLKNKHYSCYSSQKADNMPDRPEADVLSLDDLKGTAGGYTSGKKIMSGKATLTESYSSDSGYSVCKVDVSQHKRVRFPTVPGTNLIGSIFTDADGNVVDSIVVSTLGSKFEPGMYIISEVPDGAVALHFTIQNTAEFDKVVLSNSDRIEDMEPDWVANDEHLCAVVGSTVVGTELRAVISGGSTTASMAWTDFHYYSVARGMQQIDALMHSRIANLFYAKYGRRNSQEQCGAGSHTNNRTTGGTASRGMTDTIGFDEAYTINANVTNNMVDNGVHQYAWYKTTDDYGNAAVVQVNNICCLGYEDIYGHKYDMMDNVDLPNDSGNAGKWRIWMPDGTTRMVKGKTASDQWITAVAHGKYMDVIAVGSVNGSATTHYGDKYYLSTSVSRVVYHGNSYASPFGGVSFAYANYVSSFTTAYVGSRLAFRGKIVKAQSVAAYKAKASA